MRRIGSNLCFAALAISLLGAAPAQPPQAGSPAQPEAPNGLRGAQAAGPAKASAAPPPLVASLPAAEASAIPAGADQCRATCAHSYYFCLASEDAPSCPQTWSRCLADCGRSATQPETSIP